MRRLQTGLNAPEDGGGRVDGDSLPGGSLHPPTLPRPDVCEYVMTGRVETRQRWMEPRFEDHCRSSLPLFVGLNGPGKHLEHFNQSDQHDPQRSAG